MRNHAEFDSQQAGNSNAPTCLKVKRSELTNLRMVAGNERKYDKVIIDGRVKEWVGIGWIDLGMSSDADRLPLPEVVAD